MHGRKLHLLALVLFALWLPAGCAHEKPQSGPELTGLLPGAFTPLPLGSIHPAGWLERQLRIQADGLSGHLDEVWPDVAQSGWIGGQAEGWERGPYWLDGIVPLAWLLNDERLKEKASLWMDYILSHQQADGWLGPVQDQGTNKYKAYDPWPVYVFLKALTQYCEASGDERAVPAMRKFFTRLDTLLDSQPLFDWGQYRWADLVISLHWLYERTGDSTLLALAQKVHDQGYDWRGEFENFPFPQKMQRQNIVMSSHGVNNGMALKTPAVWFRQSRLAADSLAPAQMIATLDRYHGQVTGMFTCDEHLAGKNPSQGTELCTVVEYMYSLENIIRVLGDPAFGDRLELIAFNALPATFKPDMWAHQYDQQVNQAVCQVSEDNLYVDNGPRSNLYGLEPNYGCCTANLSQGWPKLATNLWMKTADGGLAAVAYAPCEVNTDLSGAPVTIRLETDYPFGEQLTFTVEARDKAAFPILLRIPAWTDSPTLKLDGEALPAPAPHTFYRVERNWSGTHTLSLRLPMPLRLQRRYHDSISLLKGPLVLALKINERWEKVAGEEPHADWAVYPESAWNYALQVDTLDPSGSVRIENKPVGQMPFSPEGAPLVAHVKGRRLSGWVLEHSAAGELATSPVSSEQPLEDLELIPYGSTDLRIGEFPLLQ